MYERTLKTEIVNFLVNICVKQLSFLNSKEGAGKPASGPQVKTQIFVIQTNCFKQNKGTSQKFTTAVLCSDFKKDTVKLFSRIECSSAVNTVLYNKLQLQCLGFESQHPGQRCTSRESCKNNKESKL